MIFIGIDIGSCAVKAVVLKKLQQTFQIIQTHYFPVHLDDTEEKQTLFKQNCLRDLANMYKNQEVKYIVCLPQNQVSTHTLNFPFKERYKIIKSLQFELEDKILFNYDQLISDITITRTDKKQARVLVFSTFKDNIIKILNSLKESKIQASLLTCEASAISNLIEARNNFHKETVKQSSALKNKNTQTTPQKQISNNLYLKIGYTHSTIFVLENGKMQNVYNFEWGAISYIQKIAAKYETSLHKAMKHICEQGFVLTQTKGYTGSQIEFAKSIALSFDTLIHKIRLLILQLEADKGYRCQKMFIFGGGSQIRNLQNLLSQELRIPVSRFAHPNGLPDWNLTKNNTNNESNLLSALGSAMEGLRKFNNPPINFLKGKFAVKFNPVSLFYSTWKHYIIIGSLSLVALFLYANIRAHQSEKLLDKISQLFRKKAVSITQLQPRNITDQRVRQFINSRKKVLKNLSLTTELSNLPSALDRLQSLSVAINKNKEWNLEIKKLYIADTKIEIHGTIAKSHVENLEKNLVDIAQKNSLKTLEQENEPSNNDGEKNSTGDNSISPGENIPFAYAFNQKKGY